MVPQAAIATLASVARKAVEAAGESARKAAEVAGALRQHSEPMVAEAEVATLATPVIPPAHRHLRSELSILDLPHDLRTNTMDSHLADQELCRSAMCKPCISNHLCLAIWSNPGSSNMEFAKPDPLTTAHRVLPPYHKSHSAPA